MMFRVVVPLALFVAVGLVARLTSQEQNPNPLNVEIKASEDGSVEVSNDGNTLKAKRIVLTPPEEVRLTERATVVQPARPAVAAVAATPAAPIAPPAAVNRENGDGGLTVAVFELQHIPVQTASQIVAQLFAGESVIAVSDDRNNRLILRATPQMHEQITAFLQRLDQPGSRVTAGEADPAGRSADVAETPSGSAASSSASASASNGSADSAKPGPAKENVNVELTFSSGDDSVRFPVAPGHPLPPGHPVRVEKDVLILNHHPQPPILNPEVRMLVTAPEGHELAVLAEQIRTLRQSQSSESDKEALSKLEATLRDRVDKAFEARQQAQRAELAVLQQQLAAIEQTIEARQRDKDQLVKQRVEDWLSGKAAEGHHGELHVRPFSFRFDSGHPGWRPEGAGPHALPFPPPAAGLPPTAPPPTQPTPPPQAAPGR